MIGSETNLSELNMKSMAGGCQICIGCGRCGKIHQDIHVLVNFLPLSTWDAKLQGDGKVLPLEESYALAVDLGTTTIAMCLTDAKGNLLGTFCRPNPQSLWGTDVLSRIQAAENSVQRGQMKQCVWQVLQEGYEALRKHMRDQNAPVTIGLAGNTTMLYLLQGYEPGELGKAPFKVSYPEMLYARLGEWPMYGFPPLSAFVGGDILAGIWSSGMWQSEKPILLVDLGTNGEIVLGNRERILACATAAGPAFEGGPCQGIWGADMISLTAELLKRGLVDETGLLSEPYFEQGIQIGGVRITQESLRSLQLAKGAVRAGVELLLAEYGCGIRDVEQVFLAGGMGNFLQPEAAVYIGLLPEGLIEKTVPVGNISLQGAVRAAVAIGKYGPEPVKEQWQQVKQLVGSVNLAEQAEFETFFLRFLEFPLHNPTKVD